jgi:hypothetical protein
MGVGDKVQKNLPMMRVMKSRVPEEWPLSNDAATTARPAVGINGSGVRNHAATTRCPAVGVNGSGGLGCLLGLGEDGRDGEE